MFNAMNNRIEHSRPCMINHFLLVAGCLRSLCTRGPDREGEFESTGADNDHAHAEIGALGD